MKIKAEVIAEITRTRVVTFVAGLLVTGGALFFDTIDPVVGNGIWTP